MEDKKKKKLTEEEFRIKLSEVADWRIPKTISLTAEGIAKKTKGRKSNEERYQEQHEQVFNEMFDGVNPTHPIQLVAIKRKGSACDDCGLICEEGRQQEYKWFEGKKKNSWRIRCNICRMYKNPYTGKYELNSAQAQAAMHSYTNGTEESVYVTFNRGCEQEE